MKPIYLPSEHDIRPVAFDSGQPGPHLVITGVVHGTEPCGQRAIDGVIREIQDGGMLIEHGKVTFVPVCNPRAYEEGKRFIDESLNGNFNYRVKTDTYEAKLVNYLRPIIGSATHFMDIHSHGCKGPPFAFIGHASQEEYEWAQAIDVGYTVYNFAHAFNEATGKKTKPFGTPMYARSQGAQAILIECGQNNSSEADEFAYQSILQTLEYHELVATYPDPEEHLSKAPEIIRLTDGCISHGDENQDLLIANRNFVPVRAGQDVAKFFDGSAIEHAPHDGYMIMPFQGRPAGSPWFYYGQTETLEEYLAPEPGHQ